MEKIVKSTINSRINELKNVEREISKKLKIAPPGSLWVKHNKKHLEYFVFNSENQNKVKYISKKDNNYISALASKNYYEKLNLSIQKELSILKSIQNKLSHINEFEKIYYQLPPERKNLVNSIFLNDEDFASAWLSEPYIKKEVSADIVSYKTDQSDIVRSKSELIIANMLSKYHIPYKYEAPLKMSDGRIIHPDFTVLNVRERKVIYWEHLGMMDDENYCQSALNRIQLYEYNNIFPGEGLILSHETKKSPINIEIIEILIKKYFL